MESTVKMLQDRDTRKRSCKHQRSSLRKTKTSNVILFICCILFLFIFIIIIFFNSFISSKTKTSKVITDTDAFVHNYNSDKFVCYVWSLLEKMLQDKQNTMFARDPLNIKDVASSHTLSEK